MKLEAKVLAQRIKRMRRKRNMTQEYLAEVANLSAVYVSLIERAQRVPSLEAMVEICNALDCTVDELLDEYLTAKPSGAPNKIELLIKDCTSAERRFLLQMCEAFKGFLKDSL